MRELRTEIEIFAPAEKVWGILTDLECFPQWNPFIQAAMGKVQEGAKLKVRIEPPGSKGMAFRPTVIRELPQRELRWLGHLLVPGLFDGEHSFEIEPSGEGRARFPPDRQGAEAEQ